MAYKRKYPDQLTIGQIERYKTLEIFENLDDAKKHRDKINGIIYTQVDSGSDYPDRLYSKGVRVVNATGIYAVV